MLAVFLIFLWFGGRESRMTAWVPEVADIITAIISLACRGGEQLRIPRVYSALSEMKGRDALLSGLYFSITGAVCYSRQIDETLHSLVSKGILVLTGRDTLVVRDDAVEEVRVGLRKKLPSSAYRSLRTASKWFYWKMFPGPEGSPGSPPG